MLIEKALCRAHVKATAGRDTRVVSSDGALDLKVSMPRELGGTTATGPILNGSLRLLTPLPFCG